MVAIYGGHMTALTQEPTVHFIVGQTNMAEPLCFMMEALDLNVMTYKNGETLMQSRNVTVNDILMIELGLDCPEMFTLLDQLVHLAIRPGIILTCHNSTNLSATDLFSADRIELLSHPFTAPELEATIEKLNARIH